MVVEMHFGSETGNGRIDFSLFAKTFKITYYYITDANRSKVRQFIFFKHMAWV